MSKGKAGRAGRKAAGYTGGQDAARDFGIEVRRIARRNGLTALQTRAAEAYVCGERLTPAQARALTAKTRRAINDFYAAK